MMSRIVATIVCALLFSPNAHAGLLQLTFQGQLLRDSPDNFLLDGATLTATYLLDILAPPVNTEALGREPLTADFETVESFWSITNRPSNGEDLLFNTGQIFKAFNLFSIGTQDVFELRPVIVSGSIFGSTNDVVLGAFGARFATNEVFPGSDFPQSISEFSMSDVSEVGSTVPIIDTQSLGGDTRYRIMNTSLSIAAVLKPVDIDIKPGDDPNSWPCKKENDSLPVAILSTESFDATNLDADSVRFGVTGVEASEVHRDENGDAKRHVEDVNKDGLPDMVFHFPFGDTGFSCDDIPDGEKSATVTTVLTGETVDGTSIEGGDSLRLVRK